MAIIDQSKKTYIEDRDERISIGIDMPFRLSSVSGSGYFETTDITLDAVKNNVRNLLNTTTGERLMQPELGLNLRNYLFEQITSETKLDIEQDIISTFQKWLPFVNLKDLTVDIDDTAAAGNRINIDVTFNISRDPNSMESVQVEIGE